MEKEIVKIAYSQMRHNMYDYNRKHGIGYHSPDKPEVPNLYAVIVYKDRQWKDHEGNFISYPLESRSYKVYNLVGKHFTPTMNGNSLWGSALDGTDSDVRLDQYDWDVDYCYMLEQN